MTISSLADACDNHWPGDLPAVLPYKVTETGGDGLIAAYECPQPGCGRLWFTGWDSRAAGWPTERRAAA